MTTTRGSAPLQLTLMGSEVAALAAILEPGCVSVPLATEAKVEVHERQGDHRALVRGFGRELLVEPALEAAFDEGTLALEAGVLRRLAPGEALEVEIDAPFAPDLASLEARADALARALEARGHSSKPAETRALAARAGSPVSQTPRGTAIAELDGSWRALDARTAPWRDEVLLLRDPHAPPGPSSRLAQIAWHEGRARDALREAARASRAGARLASRGATSLAPLVDREERALAALAPRALRDARVLERLRTAGALALRRLGERGLILVLAPRERHDAIRAAALAMNLMEVPA